MGSRSARQRRAHQGVYQLWPNMTRGRRRAGARHQCHQLLLDRLGRRVLLEQVRHPRRRWPKFDNHMAPWALRMGRTMARALQLYNKGFERRECGPKLQCLEDAWGAPGEEATEVPRSVLCFWCLWGGSAPIPAVTLPRAACPTTCFDCALPAVSEQPVAETILSRTAEHSHVDPVSISARSHLQPAPRPPASSTSPRAARWAAQAAGWRIINQLQLGVCWPACHSALSYLHLHSTPLGQLSRKTPPPAHPSSPRPLPGRPRRPAQSWGRRRCPQRRPPLT